VSELERRLAATLGVARVVCCASGTGALLVALQTVGVRRGMRVALPNLTFWATFEAVAQLGATPVLFDVDPDDLQMSFVELCAADRAHRLDAVILVHLYGWASAKLREMRAFCRERAIPLVEDGALALGMPAREALVRSLCNHGREAHYSHAHVGWNSRMGGLQAAFLLRMLDELPGILESRRTTARYYRERFLSSPRVKVLRAAARDRREQLPQRPRRRGPGGAKGRRGAGRSGRGRRANVPIVDRRPAARTQRRRDRPWRSRALPRLLRESGQPAPLYGIREDERESAARALLAAAT
jgi:dTDP-4-amino-4,6-dideoxygalactose transaminase